MIVLLLSDIVFRMTKPSNETLTVAPEPETVQATPGGILPKWTGYNLFGGVKEVLFGPVVRYGTGGNFAPSDATPTRVGGSALKNY